MAKSELEGRKVKLGGFGDKLFTLRYAGWDDEWLVIDEAAEPRLQEMGRFSGQEIRASGLLQPANAEVK